MTEDGKQFNISDDFPFRENNTVFFESKFKLIYWILAAINILFRK